MKRVTRTIKLKFPQLNQTKAKLFEEMTVEATDLANWLLTFPLAERRKLTTSKVQTRLMSALSNQVIRHATSDAGKKAKSFKRLPPEVNNQNWTLHKVGTTYSISFPTIKGTKRVPVEVASTHWQPVLEGILNGTVERGSAKIIKHRHKWYVYISVTEEVPEVAVTNTIGCDRGQNNLAVVAPKNGSGKFFSGLEVMHRRRYFQKRRQQLQEAQKFRALKKWNKKECRWMDAVNHTVSRRIVRFAEYLKAMVVIEDLEGCRSTMKQSKKQCGDSAQSLHSWSFYSLEMKLDYKLAMSGLRLVKRPAPYTSKSCSTCGTLGQRVRHDFKCPHGHFHNADLNAARNIAQWDGFACSLDLKKGTAAMALSDSENGLFGAAPNWMKNQSTGIGD